MWAERLNILAKLTWVVFLSVCVGLYAYQQRRNRDVQQHFRTLTDEETDKAWSGGQVVGDGDPDILVFSRYSCRFSQALLVRLGSLGLGEGRRPTIRLRHLVHPMDSVSYRAALGTVCADSYGRIRAREFHSALLRDGSEKRVSDLVTIADGIGISDSLGFRACLASDEAARSVSADFRDGMELGITAVPAMVVANRLVMGSLPEVEIRELLR